MTDRERKARADAAHKAENDLQNAMMNCANNSDDLYHAMIDIARGVDARIVFDDFMDDNLTDEEK